VGEECETNGSGDEDKNIYLSHILSAIKKEIENLILTSSKKERKEERTDRH
jgi:hypothetical protein